MTASALLFATTLCFGLASSILFAGAVGVTFAQSIDDLLPPLLPPLNGTSGNETDIGGNATASEPVPGSFTSPPPPQEEEEEQQPAGNETSEEGPDDIPSRPVIMPSSTDPCLDYDEEIHMVYVICNADIYDLFAGLRDDSITQQLGSGQILIYANITVNDGATFSINSKNGINYVKVAGNNGITVLGAIHIDDIRLLHGILPTIP